MTPFIYTPSRLTRLVGTLSSWLLRCLGWTVIGNQTNVPKAVLTAAPHTTNWDLFFTLLCAWTMHTPIWFMMKNSHFWWPATLLWNWLGAVPIDRSKSCGVVSQMVDAFAKRDILYLIIPPEGTRRDVPYWKTGFYHIAHDAGVPIWPWFIDYKRKRMGCAEVIRTTGDIEADFARIRLAYEEMYGPMPNCRPSPH